MTDDATISPYIALARERLRDYSPRSIEAPDAKPAAVLLLLYHDQGAERVLLTERTHKVEHHKGQISFPGGAVHDADADLGVTALRETWEEVGVHPDHVELIGRLDDMVTISDYLVAPYVGVLRKVPYEFIPQESEVETILEPPITHLMDGANLVWEEREQDGRTSHSPAYHWEGYRIWGATARMLHGFLELLR